MNNQILAGMVLLAIVLSVTTATSAADQSVPMMTVDELSGIMQNPEVMIIDVRNCSDWSGSEKKIAGALRMNPKDQGSWPLEMFKDKTLVVYCA